MAGDRWPPVYDAEDLVREIKRLTERPEREAGQLSSRSSPAGRRRMLRASTLRPTTSPSERPSSRSALDAHVHVALDLCQPPRRVSHQLNKLVFDVLRRHMRASARLGAAAPVVAVGWRPAVAGRWQRLDLRARCRGHARAALGADKQPAQEERVDAVHARTRSRGAGSSLVEGRRHLVELLFRDDLVVDRCRPIRHQAQVGAVAQHPEHRSGDPVSWCVGAGMRALVEALRDLGGVETGR